MIINRFLHPDEDGIQSYRRQNRMKRMFILVMVAVIAVTMLYSLCVSKYPLSFFESLRIVWDRLTIGPSDTVKEMIVYGDLVPRAIVSVTVGAGLAIAGAVMQSMLHNPLADPYTTGVSSGASFGAAVFIVLGISVIPIQGTIGIIGNAFVFALIPAFLILLLSVFKRITSTTMILIGIGVMYMFSALTQLLKVRADPLQMQQLYRWQLGTLAECNLQDVAIVLVVCLICGLILYRFRSDLNLLSVGDKPALTMGTDPWRVRVVCLIIVSFMTAVVVSFTGVIGFVGLVAPQIVRLFMGSDNRYLLPASAAFGGAFLIVCDCVGRVIGATGLPVGVITAIIGSPLFLYMLVKRSKRVTI